MATFNIDALSDLIFILGILVVSYLLARAFGVTEYKLILLIDSSLTVALYFMSAIGRWALVVAILILVLVLSQTLLTKLGGERDESAG